MDDQDDEPELTGYQPHDDKPLRHRHVVTLYRVVVVLGLIALIVPGILVTATTANRTADLSCSAYTRYYVPQAVGYSVRFEIFGPAGVGWNCYATEFGGDELLVTSLGIIPGRPVLPSGPLENS